jgi:hypothetical protein
MRLIVIGRQAAAPPTVCTIAYVIIYLLFKPLASMRLFSQIMDLTCYTDNTVGQRRLLVHRNRIHTWEVIRNLIFLHLAGINFIST